MKTCANCTHLWMPRTDVTPIPEFWVGRFYPHPECDRHSDGETFGHGELEPSAVGPIKAVYIHRHFGGLPAVAVALTDKPGRLPSHPLICGCGTDDDPARAVKKAMMEALERYCTYMPPRANVWKSHSPSVTTLDEGDQGQWWCDVVNLRSSATVSLPLEFVELACLRRVQRPAILADSTGMAIYRHSSGAIQRGFCEVLERAALVAACCDRVAIKLDKSTLPVRAQEFCAALYDYGYDVVAVPLRTITETPAFFVILHRRTECKGGPSLVTGSGCANSASDAILHAMFEAFAQLIEAIERWPLIVSEDSEAREVERYFFADEAASLIDAWGIADAVVWPFRDVNSDIDAAADTACGQVLVVDRGNRLTDFLGLACSQVLVPEFWPPLEKPSGPAGLPYPFG